jgi:uncharacterized protein involved in outer membrane biogenesis
MSILYWSSVNDPSQFSSGAVRSQQPDPMSLRIKLTVAVLILVAVVVAAFLLMLPRLANIDQFRPRIITNLEQQTGRNIEIARLTLTILPKLSIRADDVAIGNPPGFPPGHVLEIHKLYFDLDVASAFRRNLAIKSLELDEPMVSLLANNSGHWNTENPFRTRVQPTAWLESPANPPAISTVRINHGRVTYAAVSSSGQRVPISFDAENVSAELHDVNPYALGLNLNPVSSSQLGHGHRASVRKGGTSSFDKPLTPGPSPPRGRGASRFEDLISWNELPPSPWGRGAGGEGLVNPLQIFWVQSAAETPAAASPQRPLAARGTISAQSMRFGEFETSGFKSGLELYAGQVHLDGLSIELFGGRVTGDFAWNSSVQPSQYATHLTVSGIDTARLLMAFPNAEGKLTGTLDGHLDLNGSTPPATASTTPGSPLADEEGTGDLTIRNGTLPDLRVNADMRQLLKNIVRTGSGSADPSSFRSISADLEIGGGEIRSRQITILGNGIEMDVTGSLSPEGAGRLDYQGVGKIDAQRNGYSSVLAGILGSKISGGKITFPFTLTGTLESPRFGIKNSPWFR